MKNQKFSSHNCHLSFILKQGRTANNVSEHLSFETAFIIVKTHFTLN